MRGPAGLSVRSPDRYPPTEAGNLAYHASSPPAAQRAIDIGRGADNSKKLVLDFSKIK